MGLRLTSFSPNGHLLVNSDVMVENALTSAWHRSLILSKNQIRPEDEEVLQYFGIHDAFAALDLKGETVSQDTRSCMKIVGNRNGVSPRYFLKTFDYRTGRKRWRYVFQESHCKREYENLRFLASIGITCPKTIAFGEERSWARPLVAFLMTEELVGYQELEQALKSSPGLSSKMRRGIIDVLAKQVACMHGANYIDRDLKFRNILMRQVGDEVDLAHVDSTQGGIRSGAKFRRGVVHDLATLDKHAPKYFTNKERLRFLVVYRRRRLLSRQESTSLLHAVLERRQVLWRRGGGEVVETEGERS